MTRQAFANQRRGTHFRHIRLLAVATLLILGGCASIPPPVLGLSQARDALQRALNAQAQTYAPLEIGFAKAKLARADAAMQTQDYAIAADLAEESQANSELARVKAQLGRLHEQIKQETAENAQLRRQLLQDGSKTDASDAGDQP
ncbi:MAG TPA: DUF4398 domain-containing protein [Gammaproteobacteria bacterium]|nr:DUF4398 domain-containing protein [Gammaproteobacteria bacterium]